MFSVYYIMAKITVEDYIDKFQLYQTSVLSNHERAFCLNIVRLVEKLHGSTYCSI